MAKLNTDSPLSRRIAGAFVQFLNSVEPSSGVDSEAIDVVKECLAEAFKLNSSSTGDDESKSDSLIDIFSSLGENEQNQATESGPTPGAASTNAPGSSSAQNVANGKGGTNGSSAEGVSSPTDELWDLFFGALDKLDFFTALPDGSDDPDQEEAATILFHDLIYEMHRSGRRVFNRNTMAEALKTQGNRAMQSALYNDAINMYSLAIALIEDYAVYYCNRAAAYTQLKNYDAAIRDCLKAIQIDPNYRKAYSRLGSAYDAQGNYHDALEKGFKKALELDPSNAFVKEHIRESEQKLREQQQRTGREWDQNTSSSLDNQGSQPTGGPATDGPSTSMPFSYFTSANGPPHPHGDSENNLNARSADATLYWQTHQACRIQGSDDDSLSSPDETVNKCGTVGAQLSKGLLKQERVDLIYELADKKKGRKAASGMLA